MDKRKFPITTEDYLLYLSDLPDPQPSSKKKSSWLKSSFNLGILVLLLTLITPIKFDIFDWFAPKVSNDAKSQKGTQPLVMKGGDPYIRALMRTISASEANFTSPYTVIYGGDHVEDLSHHPNRCIPIEVGPNKGLCSTAAGRYQFINTTWYEKAELYHPKKFKIGWLKFYSFEPEYQDLVVHSWLSDKNAWGKDIPKLLRQGKLTEVLKLLSNTWTSLGYGIETNVMSPHLPKIYQKMLAEELQN